MSIDLFNAKEKKQVKDLLLKEQGNVCFITGTPIAGPNAVLDHRHDDACLVRGVLNRQVNSCVGVIENSWKRYMNWWYTDDTLPDFLRQVANYLEKEEDNRYRHDAWIKRVNIEFNKLNEGSKRAVLRELGQPEGGNATERKKFFQKAVLTKKHNFDKLKEMIERNK